MKSGLLFCGMALALPTLAAPVMRDNAWRFDTAAGAVVFDHGTGAMRVEAGGQTIWQTGPAGLWTAGFDDQSSLGAKDCQPAITVDGESLRLAYSHAKLAVTVTVRAVEGGVELGAEVSAKQGTVLEFGLPGRLTFDPEATRRLIMPESGTESVGTAYAGRFFAKQDDDHPSGWAHGQTTGPAGYVSLYGGGLAQGVDNPTPVALRVTEQAAEWLPESLRGQIGRVTSQVNRPPAAGQADLVLVDSADGAWLSAKRLAQGYLWRIGAKVGDDDGPLAVQALRAVIARQLAAAPMNRRRIALLKLPNGPPRGSWSSLAVDDWANGLRNLAGAEYVELKSAKELLAALASDRFAAVVNPYGEGCVAPAEGGMPATVAAVRAYTERGGNWFEVAGYPFYYILEPVRFFQRGVQYPPAFADFQAIEAAAGTSVVYRAALPSQPWDRDNLFAPGRLACGGEEAGGWCERPFGCYVTAGQAWTTPAVRVKVGGDVPAHLADYAVANGITRKLSEKFKPEVWAKFRQAVMVKFDGPAAEKTAHLHQLPVPTVVHFSDYLKGGFDKQYPDHLPPNPNFGTPEEFRRFLAKARELGHLTMPYTNPTWWCDNPKGPTFERHGDAPLLRRLDGKLSPESYGTGNATGFSITLWHPAVQEVNRKVRTEFLQDYPIDILFQDQCGARAWRWDTNPASPTPAAYADGMISMVDEDAAVFPLSTEGGWDGIINGEAQFAGLSWGIVPTVGGPSWRSLMRDRIPTDLWTVYPITQYLAQDKCSFIYHDLGQFVTNREVLAWTVGLGFNMTYRCRATDVDNPAVRDWIGWLDVLQKNVCSRYLGGTLTGWDHTRAAGANGVIQSGFGDLSIAANLDAAPVKVGDETLAGFGFRATAPGLVAANLQSVGDRAYGPDGVQFVATGDAAGVDIWVYERPESQVTIELPQPMAGQVRVAFEGLAPQTVAGGATVSFKLPPADQAALVQVPAALAGKAPVDWPGGPPAVGVLDIPGLGLSWTEVTADEWVAGLADVGVPIKRITTQAQVAAALAAGPTTWLAIVNPYGEQFPIIHPDQAEAMLKAIAEYVRQGGSWVETGGYSFYSGVAPDGRAAMGSKGASTVGIDIGDGLVEALAESLRVTADGQQWYGAEAAAALEQQAAMVNRGLPSTRRNAPQVALIQGDSNVFFGAYRLGGWGYLWRLGGFRPPAAVAVPAVAGALRHLATSPPAAPVPAGPIRLLRGRITPAG